MGSGVMNKLQKLLGIDPEEGYDDEEYEEVEDTPEEDRETNTGLGWGRKNKVAMMPGMQNVRVVISQPNSYEQASEICEHLKGKKSIIVNLEYVNKDVARRIIDFMSGAVYALDGNIQKISNSIFLIAPYNYEITNEVIKEQVKEKAATNTVSWIK
ncbi:MAG: cell division protein SepF [Clostridia bacterium]|nr:cell division protein SepF [Clostridia bacterium]